MILYHYCSNNAFYFIIKNRAICLSSLSLSNDSMEGKLVTDIIVEMAKSDSLDQATIQKLQSSVSVLEKIIEGLGFCLSEEGDLLSQWRGYADDASGISVGFSKNYLEQLAKATHASKQAGVTLQKVEYERNAQEGLIKPTYNKVKELINEGAYKIPGRRSLLDSRPEQEIEKDNEKIKNTFYKLSMLILPLFSKFFLLKTRAFREEREWRLISYLIKVGKDKCSFRPFPDRIIPYRKFPLLDLKEKPIAKIVLGPKNKTPEYVIDTFLKQNNFENIRVVRSEASFR